jgi:hypothetical protein
MKNFWILQKASDKEPSSNINYICFFLESIEKNKFPVLKIDNKQNKTTKNDVRLYVMIKSNSSKTDEMIMRFLGHVSVLKNSIQLIFYKNFVKGNELKKLTKQFNKEPKTSEKEETQEKDSNQKLLS